MTTPTVFSRVNDLIDTVSANFSLRKVTFFPKDFAKGLKVDASHGKCGKGMYETPGNTLACSSLERKLAMCATNEVSVTTVDGRKILGCGSGSGSVQIPPAKMVQTPAMENESKLIILEFNTAKDELAARFKKQVKDLQTQLANSLSQIPTDVEIAKAKAKVDARGVHSAALNADIILNIQKDVEADFLTASTHKKLVEFSKKIRPAFMLLESKLITKLRALGKTRGMVFALDFQSTDNNAFVKPSVAARKVQRKKSRYVK